MEQPKQPKTHLNILKAMKKYIHSEKGKITRTKYLTLNKERIKEYTANYQKQKRQKALAQQICTNCYKEKIKEGNTRCEKCLQKQKMYHNKRKERIQAQGIPTITQK
jgi:7-cyano-7-deazaguanine synthase in queuosine biosynthesis